MARLIDAKALEKQIKESIEDTNPVLMGQMLRWVRKQTTIDAVPVVRCKDCMWARPKDHREPTDTPRELICQCFQHHYIPAPWGARMAVKPDDFCSYGERKDNGSWFGNKGKF